MYCHWVRILQGSALLNIARYSAIECSHTYVHLRYYSELAYIPLRWSRKNPWAVKPCLFMYSKSLRSRWTYASTYFAEYSVQYTFLDASGDSKAVREKCHLYCTCLRKWVAANVFEESWVQKASIQLGYSRVRPLFLIKYICPPIRSTEY